MQTQLRTSLAAPGTGHADAPKDLGVTARAPTFLENGPSGRTLLSARQKLTRGLEAERRIPSTVSRDW